MLIKWRNINAICKFWVDLLNKFKLFENVKNLRWMKDNFSDFINYRYLNYSTHPPFLLFRFLQFFPNLGIMFNAIFQGDYIVPTKSYVYFFSGWIVLINALFVTFFFSFKFISWLWIKFDHLQVLAYHGLVFLVRIGFLVPRKFKSRNPQYIYVCIHVEN